MWPRKGEPSRFQEGFACDTCGRTFPAPDPALFSFNSPLGACEECQGFGRVQALDFDREAARGRRLDIAAGTAVRFEPGQSREVKLVPLLGKRAVYGFNQKIMGELD